MNKKNQKFISVFLALLFILHTSISVAATSDEYEEFVVYRRSDTEYVLGKRYTGTSVPARYEDAKHIADGAVRIDDSESYHYNCFSYAFSFDGEISRLSEDELFTIDNPSWYFSCNTEICEPSLPEDIDASKIQLGDLILYYPNPDLQMVSKNPPYTHVAIVISTSDNLEDIVVESKWGEHGIYKHPIFACPYFTFGHTNGLNNTYEDDSISVRRPNHRDATVLEQLNNATHICKCAYCGAEYKNAHNFYRDGVLYYCACGYSTRFPNFINSEENETETE